MYFCLLFYVQAACMRILFTFKGARFVLFRFSVYTTVVIESTFFKYYLFTYDIVCDAISCPSEYKF